MECCLDWNRGPLLEVESISATLFHPVWTEFLLGPVEFFEAKKQQHAKFSCVYC